jgi:hypothetical protein
VISGTVTYVGSAVAAINAGTYTITPIVSGLSAANYTFASANGTLNISTVPLTVKADNKSKIFDGNPFTAFTSTISGFVNGENASVITGSITYSGSAVGATTVGTYTITPIVTGLSATNYSFTAVNGTLAIGAWNATGFYAPVGTANSTFVSSGGALPSSGPTTVWNTIKGGQTVPLKFNVYAGTVEKTSTSDISGFSTITISCTAGDGTDVVDFTTTGGTSLRYDTTAMQWIQNWKTPAYSASASCYRTRVQFADGSSIIAFFKLTK